MRLKYFPTINSLYFNGLDNFHFRNDNKKCHALLDLEHLKKKGQNRKPALSRFLHFSRVNISVNFCYQMIIFSTRNNCRINIGKKRLRTNDHDSITCPKKCISIGNQTFQRLLLHLFIQS